jgi:hypothetical protein
MSDDLKDEEVKEDEEKEEESEIGEPDLEAASEEPDFAPTAAAPVVDEDDDIESDPHASFDAPVESEDPHMDIYGDGGVPGAEDSY